MQTHVWRRVEDARARSERLHLLTWIMLGSDAFEGKMGHECVSTSVRSACQDCRDCRVCISGPSASAKRWVAPMIVELTGPRQSDRKMLDIFTPSRHAYAGWLAYRSHALDRASSVPVMIASRSTEDRVRYSMRGGDVGSGVRLLKVVIKILDVSRLLVKA